jgi:peptidoglycan/LPS O-acetylase OafA/YrhL
MASTQVSDAREGEAVRSPDHPSPAALQPTERYPGLDSLRAYAACSIIAFHMVHAAKASLPGPLAFLGSYLGFGVPLFFVVSAFSMSVGYHGRMRSGGDCRRFYLRRLARIAPLFYGVLLYQLFYLYFRYGMTRSWTEIAASLTFTFNFAPSLVDGIVPASWSVGVEMVFYAVFPMLILLGEGAIGSLMVLMVSLLMCALHYTDLTKAANLNPSYIYHGFVTCLPFFASGLLFHRFHASMASAARSGPGWLRPLLGLGLLGVGCYLFRYLVDYSPLYAFFWNKGLRAIWDTLWCIPFGMFCVGLALHPFVLVANPVARYLGKISFSLYLLHPSIVFALGEGGVYAKVYAYFAGNLWGAFSVCFLLTVGLVSLLSSVSYRFIEEPGMRLGRWACSRLTD